MVDEVISNKVGLDIDPLPSNVSEHTISLLESVEPNASTYYDGTNLVCNNVTGDYVISFNPVGVTNLVGKVLDYVSIDMVVESNIPVVLKMVGMGAQVTKSFKELTGVQTNDGWVEYDTYLNEVDNVEVVPKKIIIKSPIGVYIKTDLLNNSSDELGNQISNDNFRYYLVFSSESLTSKVTISRINLTFYYTSKYDEEINAVANRFIAGLVASQNDENISDDVNTYKAIMDLLNSVITGGINSLNNSITNKLSKGDWTLLDDEESYLITKTDMITTDAWVMDGLNGETVTQTSVTAPQDDYFTYINKTNKKIQITLTGVSGDFIINGSDQLSASGEELTYILNPNQSIGVISKTPSQLNYTVGTQSNIISSIIDVTYPVGSIYISSTTMHPSVTFGGVWEHFAEDKFLLSAGSKYGYNTSGGSADAVVVKHNHTQNPHNHTQNAHSHGTKYDGNSYVVKEKTSGASNRRVTVVSSGSTYVDTSSGANFHNYNATESITATNQQQTATNKEAGVDGTGKNMPPYLAVFMWKRIG